MKKTVIFTLLTIMLVCGFIGCDTEPVIYTVTIGTLTNGSITATPDRGTVGTEISLTVTPHSGYQLKAGTLKYGSVSINESTKKFNLPAENVTVTAEFELIIAEIFRINYEDSAWYGHEGISAFELTTTTAIVDNITYSGIYTQGGGTFIFEDDYWGNLPAEWAYFYCNGIKIGIGFLSIYPAYDDYDERYYGALVFGTACIDYDLEEWLNSTGLFFPPVDLSDLGTSPFNSMINNM